MSRQVGFISLGCAKNRVDSEKIMGLLRSGGFSLTNDPAKADYLFINTCGFIDAAKEESINTILEMADYKHNKCRKLIVMGCLAQRYARQLKEQLPEIDRLITLDEYPRLKEILAEELGAHFDAADPERLLSTEPWLGYLKIAEGCYNRCSYCAIPLIRGSYQSVPLEELVREAERLAAGGVKELVLVAQDTTMYGIDLYRRKMLGELVRILDQIAGLRWIRILYLYPSETDDALLEQLRQCRHFIPYFDLPLQYGNDRMLKLMNRKGSIAGFRRTVKNIRERFPDAVLRTTMIVGFPSETEADFAELLEFIKTLRFDRLGGFAYSREADTPAYEMRPQIPKRIKEARLKRLLQAQEAIAQSCGERQIGRTLDVVIERTEELTGRYVGRSYASAPDQIDGEVVIDSSVPHQLGEFVRVKIKQAVVHDLIGEETAEG